MAENEGNGQGQGNGEGQGGSGQGEGQGEGQGSQEDWRSGFQDDLKAEKSLDSFTNEDGSLNVEAMAKTTVEGQKMIGGSVRIPKEDATPEEMSEFYGKMGRPDDAAGYELVKPEDLPEGVQWDEAMVDWFGKAAHGAGLSKAQAGALMKSWNDQQYSMGHEAQKVMKDGLDNLHESWGDKFDGRVELGLRGIERLLPPEEVKELKTLMDSSGMGNNPIMLKYVYQVGRMLKEDGYIMGDGHGGVLGAESAKAKIKEIYADKKHPWHTGDKDALEEMTQLYKIAKK